MADCTERKLAGATGNQSERLTGVADVDTERFERRLCTEKNFGAYEQGA